MCRNIKTLYNFEPPPTQDEIKLAAVQYVRKISGFRKPSAVNNPAFELAVAEIIASSKKLFESLVTTATPKNREVEAKKARERNRLRFGNK